MDYMTEIGVYEVAAGPSGEDQVSPENIVCPAIAEAEEPRWHVVLVNGRVHSTPNKGVLRAYIDSIDPDSIRLIFNGRLIPMKRSVSF